MKHPHGSGRSETRRIGWERLEVRVALFFALTSGGLGTWSPAAFAAKIAVFSDIHVFTSGRIPERFPSAVAEVVKRKPDAVVLAGDSTSGNQNDKMSSQRVALWWSSLQQVLQPLREAGIPVLPIAGNHDYYTSAHKEGYVKAWDLAAWAGVPGSSKLQVEGNYPLQYSVQLGEKTELLMLPIVTQAIPAGTSKFIEEYARTHPEVPQGGTRIAFGHVPLASRMGKTTVQFQKNLGSLLVASGVQTYVSGHEHLTWDESLPVNERGDAIRQVWVGTSSGTYNFPIRQNFRIQHCSGTRRTECTMPSTGKKFSLDPRSFQQVHGTVFGWIDTDSGEVSFVALRKDGSWGDFYE